MITTNIFIYDWHIDEKDTENTKIRVYGLDKKNRSICLLIDNFTPYVYLELPSHTIWDNRKAQLLGNCIDEELREQAPLSKSLILKGLCPSKKLLPNTLNCGLGLSYSFLFCLSDNTSYASCIF